MAHRLHALVLRRQGLWDESAATFRRAIECDESGANVATAELGLALTCWRGGNIDTASGLCAKLSASATAPPHLKSRAQVLAAAFAAARLDAQQALELGQQALEQQATTADSTPALHAVCAWAARSLGAVSRSVTHYEHAIRSYSETPGTSKELSKALFGAPPEAVLDLLLGQATLACAREEGAEANIDPGDMEEKEEQACDRIERALILTEGSLGAEAEGSRARSIAVSCCRELGLHAG